MGARTSNRKHGDECLSLNRACPSLNSSDFPVSKKPRFISITQSPNRSVSSNATVARLSRYPEETPKLTRELHAPCRTLKFGILKSSNLHSGPRNGGVHKKDDIGDVRESILRHNYNKAKNSALGALRCLKRDKEIIELDAETEDKRGVSEDSSIEEVEVITEDGREGRQVVLDQRTREVDGVVVNVQELDTETVDGRNQPSSSSMVTNMEYFDLKVDNAEKMLDALSPNRDLSSVSVYKKMLDNVWKRNSILKNLDFDIELYEKRRSFLHLERPERKPVKEAPQEPFIPLTEEEEAEVEHAFSANRRKILVAHENSNIEISGEKFQCLRPGAWLNDEVINLYLELLKERETREPKKFLKCHFFNSFFYKKLTSGRGGYDYKSVRRWTSQRKLGYELIQCDKIFVPIHKEIHWCLAVINKKDEKFQYLDSLKGWDSNVIKVLAKYFVDEVKDKSGKDIDVSSWKQEFVEDLPEQENGFDCGMFMIKYTDFYSRGLELCFNQVHMPYFRVRTAKEILRLRAD